MSLQLAFAPALSRVDLLAAPVAAALRGLPGADDVEVAEIDPALADTAAFCERYGVAAAESAGNCVVIAARRGGETRYAACMVAATTRADVNGLVRRHLDARKASFAGSRWARITMGYASRRSSTTAATASKMAARRTKMPASIPWKAQ